MTKRIPPPNPGLHRVDHQSYLLWDAVSNSDLSNAQRSLAHYHYRRAVATDETPSMATGTVVHTAVLEPSVFEARYCLEPDPATVAPEAKNPRATTAWKEAVAELERSGRKVITRELWDTARRVRDNIARNAGARDIMAKVRAHETSVSGLPLYGVRDIPTKCRPDGLGDGFLLDLKTTRSTSPRDFERSAYALGYHRQLAWYSDCLKSVGVEVDGGCYILAVENTPPNEVRVYRVATEALAVGRTQAMEIYYRLEYAIKANEFPGHPDDITELRLPKYALHEEVGDES